MSKYFFGSGVNIMSGTNSSIISSTPTTVSINGVIVTGKSIVVKDGVLTVDGKPPVGVDASTLITRVEIVVNGNVDGSVRTDSGEVSVTGDVKQGVKTMSGGVDVGGKVLGNVETMSGSINVEGSISGKVTTMSGSVRHR
jgi:hypothetical protein